MTMKYQVWGRQSASKRVNKTDKETVREKEKVFEQMAESVIRWMWDGKWEIRVVNELMS